MNFSQNINYLKELNKEPTFSMEIQPFTNPFFSFFSQITGINKSLFSVNSILSCSNENNLIAMENMYYHLSMFYILINYTLILLLFVMLAGLSKNNIGVFVFLVLFSGCLITTIYNYYNYYLQKKIISDCLTSNN